MKQLREIFDTHYPYQKNYVDDSGSMIRHRYTFNSLHGSYNVHISDYPVKNNKKESYVMFSNKEGGVGKTSIEGHDAHKVFGTVKKIVSDHVKTNKIHQVAFSGEKKTGHSRTKLYDRMIKGYKNNNIDNINDDKRYEIKVK